MKQIRQARHLAGNCMLPASKCSEEWALRERYSAALEAYRKQVTTLNAVSTDAEFEDAYERAETERVLFVRARFLHRYHIQEHGCVVEEAAGAC